MRAALRLRGPAARGACAWRLAGERTLLSLSPGEGEKGEASPSGAAGRQLRRSFASSALPNDGQHLTELRRRAGWSASRQLHLAAPALASQAVRPAAADASPGHGAADAAAAVAAGEAQAARVLDLTALAEVRAEAARSLKEAKAEEAGYLRSALGLLRSLALWMLSVPSKLAGLASLSRAEWAAMFSRAWKVVKDEAHHYWVGTKLLHAEMKISARLVGNVLQGNSLSRRERKQLTRTTADMFRLVPLLVILIVPFMELALPVLLKVFPNMLPSTFQDKLKHEEALKSQLTAKLELAKFLQDTTEEMAKMLSRDGGRSGDVQATAAELYDFMKRVRSGARVSNDDIKRFAKLFNDEITLDSVDRVQLVNMCKFVNIPSYGTDTFLRYQLRNALKGIKADDRMIHAEGVESLTYDELRAACRSRGMRWDGESTASMRSQLEDWLELSLSAALPSSLLILSRAFTITHQRLEDAEAATVSDLEATLASLPDEVLKKVEQEACVSDDSAAQKLRRLEMLRHEEEMIKEEREDLRDASKALAEAQLAESASAAAMEAAFTQRLSPGAPAAAQASAAASAADSAAAPAAAAASPAAVPPPPPPLADIAAIQTLSAEELSSAAMAERRREARRLARALATLAGASPVASERAEFAQLLRKEVLRYESGGAAPILAEEGARRLSDRLGSILGGLEKQLDSVDAAIGQKLHRLDLNRDGRLERSELAGAAAGLLGGALGAGDLRRVLGPEVFDEEGRLSIKDLLKLAQAGEEDEELPPLEPPKAAAAAAAAGAEPPKA